MEAYAETLVEEAGIKSRSKREMHDNLVSDGCLYFLPISDWQHMFKSIVMVRYRKLLKSGEVKVCFVPHLDGFKAYQISSFQSSMSIFRHILQTTNISSIQIAIGCDVYSTQFLDKRFQDFIQAKIWERAKNGNE